MRKVERKADQALRRPEVPLNAKHPQVAARPGIHPVSTFSSSDTIEARHLAHTATSGLSEAFGLTPQDAAFSPRNTAGFLPVPQYAVTITSLTSQLT
jgi:hypothetical protein